VNSQMEGEDELLKKKKLIIPKLSGFCWPVISQFIQHRIRHIWEISKVICKQ